MIKGLLLPLALSDSSYKIETYLFLSCTRPVELQYFSNSPHCPHYSVWPFLIHRHHALISIFVCFVKHRRQLLALTILRLRIWRILGQIFLVRRLLLHLSAFFISFHLLPHDFWLHVPGWLLSPRFSSPFRRSAPQLRHQHRLALPRRVNELVTGLATSNRPVSQPSVHMKNSICITTNPSSDVMRSA